MKYYFLAIRNIFNYKGEASIKEFWSFFLITYFGMYPLLQFCIHYLNLNAFTEIVFMFTSLAVLLPLGIRRLRNAGQPVWYFLFPLVNLMMAGIPDKNEPEEE